MSGFVTLCAEMERVRRILCTKKNKVKVLAIFWCWKILWLSSISYYVVSCCVVSCRVVTYHIILYYRSTNDYLKSVVNFVENVSNYIISTAAADALSPRGAKTSAGTPMTKFEQCNIYWWLVEERHNSIVNTLVLHISCTNPSIWPIFQGWFYLVVRLASERWRYFVTTSLIGWGQT